MVTAGSDSQQTAGLGGVAGAAGTQADGGAGDGGKMTTAGQATGGAGASAGGAQGGAGAAAAAGTGGMSEAGGGGSGGGVGSSGAGAGGSASGAAGSAGTGPVQGAPYWSMYCENPADEYSCAAAQPAAKHLWHCTNNVAPPTGNFCELAKPQPAESTESVWCGPECIRDPSFDHGNGQHSCPAENPTFYQCVDDHPLGLCVNSWSKPTGGGDSPVTLGGRCCSK